MLARLASVETVPMQEVFLTNDYICIAMEYASGGSLFHYMQRVGSLKEPAARCVVPGASRGLTQGVLTADCAFVTVR